ncbi:MAG: hypothetical protein ACFFEN_02865 [Candidatus Thorarchaeota archaeon]
MVLMVVTVHIPPDKANELAKSYIESLKKYPPDPSISKTLAIGVRPTKYGYKIIGVGDVVKGKFGEAFLRQVQSSQEASVDIEGYRYEIETFMDITEAMPIVGMKAPEDR